MEKRREVHDQVTEELLSAEPIADLGEAWRYISAIDFTAMREKLTNPDFGEPWITEKLDFCEREYRRWLFLCRKFTGEVLSPSFAMDEYWHAHMLDTRAYMRDCARIFGRYVHHNPYLGMAGPEDEERLREAGERTIRYYAETFQEALYDIDYGQAGEQAS
jgi:hypothetical protein